MVVVLCERVATIRFGRIRRTADGPPFRVIEKYRNSQHGGFVSNSIFPGHKPLCAARRGKNLRVLLRKCCVLRNPYSATSGRGFMARRASEFRRGNRRLVFVVGRGSRGRCLDG